MTEEEPMTRRDSAGHRSYGSAILVGRDPQRESPSNNNESRMSTIWYALNYPGNLEKS